MSLQSATESRILKQTKMKGFVTPNYEGLGLSNIMPSIFEVLGQKLKGQHSIDKELFDPKDYKGIKKVVFLVLDGFGYYNLQQEMKKKKLRIKELTDKGSFFPLTSTLPSTTPTALSTFGLGMTPQEHGIVGFNLLLKEFGVLTDMIMFGPRGGFWSYADIGADPIGFVQKETVFQKLKKKRIHTNVIMKKDFVGSPFYFIATRDENAIPAESSSDIFVEARNVLKKERGRAFVHLYIDTIDVLSHVHGANSENMSAEVAKLDFTLFEELIDKIKQDDTLLIITSDHGTLNSKPKPVIFSDMEGLSDCLRAPPGGDMRLPYLYVKDSKMKKATKIVSKLKDVKILKPKDLLEKGFFGINKPRKETLDRLGDIIILPKKNQMFVNEKPEGGKRMIGVHGAMSKEEMLVPFIAARLG